MKNMEKFSAVLSDDQPLILEAQAERRKTRIRAIDPSRDRRWDEFVMNHDNGSLYHTSAWKEVIQRTYGYKPFYFILEDDRNEILAGLPIFLVRKMGRGARLISLPFSDSCDPLFTHPDQLDEILQAVMEKYHDFGANRIRFKLDRESECMNHLGFQKVTEDKNHVLELPLDFGDLLRGFPKDIRRSIKKAEKSDLKIVECNSVKDLKVFYKLMLATRKRLGLPPQPFRYFKHLWDLLGTANRAYSLIALEDSRPVAGCFGVIYKDRMYSLYACSDHRFLQNRPNHLIIWKELEKANELGLKYYDFGRTAGDNTGLLEFKRKWRGQERDYYYVDFPQIESSQGQVKFRHIYSVLTRMMPRPIFRMSGTIIYQYFS